MMLAFGNQNDFAGSSQSSNLTKPSDKNYFSRNIFQPPTLANLYNEYTIELDKTINFVEFSHLDNSTDILACGTQEHVYIFRILFLNEKEDLNEELRFNYQFVRDYIIGSKANSIAFSPKTDFSLAHNHIIDFAIAGDDFCILTLNQTVNDDSTLENCNQQLIRGHTDYINSMAFEPNSGDLLASASDDCTCCVWSLINQENSENPNLEMKIQLSSPGISVKWHVSEPNKVLIN